jgi:hypothetical protein
MDSLQYCLETEQLGTHHGAIGLVALEIHIVVCPFALFEYMSELILRLSSLYSSLSRRPWSQTSTTSFG